MLLAVGDNRQHGGNLGYEDDVEACYRWDDTVPNHGRVAVGDVVALWDKVRLLGTAIVSRIEAATDQKTVRRCARCSSANIKARKTKQPLFRCFDCFSEFDEPLAFDKLVRTYAASYPDTWRPSDRFVPAATLRNCALSPRAQNSIRQLDWGRFVSGALSGSRERELLVASRVLSEGHVLRTVRLRVGQAAFRHRLLSLYGPRCAISGDCPLSVLDAAHLYSYAGTGRHHDQGGLLLRRDIHRLFDVGELAVDPETTRVDLDDSVAVFPAYAPLAGQALTVDLTPLQQKWLLLHWRQHRC